MRLLIVALSGSAAVSIGLALVMFVVVRGESARRYAGALGFAAGFAAAYAWLEPRNLSPSLSWHWLPWLATAAAIIGPVGIATGVRMPERWALSVVFALAAAWLLVPTRATFQPWRLTYLMAFASVLVLSWNVLDQLAQTGTGRSLSAALALTSLASSALIAYTVSLRIGFLTAASASALIGVLLTTIWTQDRTILRGALPCHGVVLCGAILTSSLDDGFPRYAPLLILIAPQMLWLFQFGPLAKLRGSMGLIARAIAIAAPLSASPFV